VNVHGKLQERRNWFVDYLTVLYEEQALLGVERDDGVIMQKELDWS
jgi:hypothetical protein